MEYCFDHVLFYLFIYLFSFFLFPPSRAIFCRFASFFITNPFKNPIFLLPIPKPTIFLHFLSFFELFFIWVSLKKHSFRFKLRTNKRKMALEAVVFSQDLYTSFGGGIWTNGSFQFPQIPHDFPEKQTENYPFEDWNSSSSVLLPIPSPEEPAISRNPPLEAESRTPNPIRPRKRRPKSRKNKEDIENQRMTHIAVERNRRKQMNEYLSVLRSLMPESYVQRVSLSSSVLHFPSSKQKLNGFFFFFVVVFRGIKLQLLGELLIL